jgi:oligopeptide/dipeptide ABC transporter ATP-binding protein
MPPNLADLPAGCRFGPRCPYALKECRDGELPLRAVGEGHYSRCIRAEELAKPPILSEKGERP